MVFACKSQAVFPWTPKTQKIPNTDCIDQAKVRGGQWVMLGYSPPACSRALFSWLPDWQPSTHQVTFSYRCRPPPCASPSAWVALWSWAVCLHPRCTSSCFSPRRMWSHTGCISTGSVSVGLGPPILSVSMECSSDSSQRFVTRDQGGRSRPGVHLSPGRISSPVYQVLGAGDTVDTRFCLSSLL